MIIKKLLFIYNPHSGRGTIETFLPEILKKLQQSGYMVTLFRTKGPGEATEIAAQEGAAFERIVCAGGDGTLNEVINGVMRIEQGKRPDVGFIPAGSTNDTRNSYKLPANISHAARVAVGGVPFASDIGKLNEKYFTYVASFGEISAVSCFTPQAAKNIFGHAAYISEGLKAILKMNSNFVKVTYDGNTLSGDFILGMVTNALSVGGFANITGPNVNLQDGIFEVLLVKKPADLAEFNKEIESVLIDTQGQPGDVVDADSPVIKLKARNITFESEDDVQWVIDGENAGKSHKAEIINLNRAVNIISGKY